jgi:hypothetical protein
VVGGVERPGEAHLPQVVELACLAAGLSRAGEGRQEQSQEKRDDRDDGEHLDHRESTQT